LFASATNARIFFAGVADGEPTSDEARFESDHVGELQSLLEIEEPQSGFHCMCLGSVAVELLADGARVAVIGLHHGESIRLDGWPSDAPLVDGRPLANWLAAHGLPELLEEMNDTAKRRTQGAMARERWQAAMPSGIAVHLDALADFTGGPRHGLKPDELQTIVGALLAEYQTPVAACSALLRWFGAGEGPWSGYPSYEGLAEVLLLHMRSELVAASLEFGDDDVALGAARYFAGWTLSQTRPEDVGLLNDEARERLLECARRTGIDDNLQRLSFALERG